jgi:hypothetical protein
MNCFEKNAYTASIKATDLEPDHVVVAITGSNGEVVRSLTPRLASGLLYSSLAPFLLHLLTNA